jgi:hypothetical protein
LLKRRRAWAGFCSASSCCPATDLLSQPRATPQIIAPNGNSSISATMMREQFQCATSGAVSTGREYTIRRFSFP